MSKELKRFVIELPGEHIDMLQDPQIEIEKKFPGVGVVVIRKVRNQSSATKEEKE